MKFNKKGEVALSIVLAVAIIAVGAAVITWQKDGFTGYSILSETYMISVLPNCNISCGGIISSSCKLNHSLNCSGDGIIINASDIVFYCDGYTIEGDGVNKSINIIDKDNITIVDCELRNFEYGIYSSSFPASRNFIIINNRIIDMTEEAIFYDTSGALKDNISNNYIENTDGIHFYAQTGGTDPTNNYFFNNTIVDNSYYAIDVQNTDGYIISNNIINNSLYGILIFSTHGAPVKIISNNQIYNISIGLNLDAVSELIVSNNTIDNATSIGIGVDGGSTNINITNNTIKNCNQFGARGIDFDSSTNDNLIYNNIFNNSDNVDDAGTNYWNTSYSCINGSGQNIIGGDCMGGNYWSDYDGYDNNSDGIGDTKLPYNGTASIQNGGDWLPLTNNVKPLNCSCVNCSDCMAKLNSNCSVVNLTKNITTTGSCIDDPANFSNKVFDCRGHSITGDGDIVDYGILINKKDNNKIKNCYLSNFGDGIYIQGSFNSTIINNTANNNTEGIFLRSYNSNNTFYNNTIIKNTANYNSKYGFYIRSSCNNNKIINNTAKNNNIYGFYISTSCNNNTIINCTSNENGNSGVYLVNSFDNNFMNNKFISNSNYGLNLYYSDRNIFVNNVLDNNSFVLYYADQNVLNKNNVSNSYNGIFVSRSFDNNISSNIIVNNSLGIEITESNDNLIYNNFFDNVENVNDTYSGGFGNNSWNTTYNCGAIINIIGGSCIGGNYWSDYNGTDNGNGTYPHNISGDGIGDTDLPYNGSASIDNGGDYLPLTNKTESAAINCSCVNCSDCMDKLNNNCSVVNLTQDITVNGTCINNPSNFSNKIFDCDGYSITGNNSGYGININQSNNTIKNCNIFNFDTGIYINSSDNIIIDSNTIKDVYTNGISIEGRIFDTANNITIINNNISYVNLSFGGTTQGNGISIYGTENNYLANNIVTNAYRGYSFTPDNLNNTLINNTAKNNRDDGFYFDGRGQPGFHNLTSNTADNNSGYGFNLFRCRNLSLINNTAYKNNYGFYIDGQFVSPDTILKDNKAEKNSDGIYIKGSFSKCSLESNEIYNNSNGMNILVSNIVIEYNKVGNNSLRGMWIRGIGSNVTENIVYNNNQGGVLGGFVIDNDKNRFTNNSVYNNSRGFLISGWTESNNITSNNVYNNSCGFYLTNSDKNKINKNMIENNILGINISLSDDNLIYNNYFNNTINVDDSGNNYWNTTYNCSLGTNIIGGNCTGGNYWSDYDGKDTDGDGIGDTKLPYNGSASIDNGGDWFPLTSVGVSKPEEDGGGGGPVEVIVEKEEEVEEEFEEKDKVNVDTNMGGLGRTKDNQVCIDFKNIANESLENVTVEIIKPESEEDMKSFYSRIWNMGFDDITANSIVQDPRELEWSVSPTVEYDNVNPGEVKNIGMGFFKDLSSKDTEKLRLKITANGEKVYEKVITYRFDKTEFIVMGDKREGVNLIDVYVLIRNNENKRRVFNVEFGVDEEAEEDFQKSSSLWGMFEVLFRGQNTKNSKFLGPYPVEADEAIILGYQYRYDEDKLNDEFPLSASLFEGFSKIKSYQGKVDLSEERNRSEEVREKLKELTERCRVKEEVPQKEEIKCIDSDGGMNYYEKGDISGPDAYGGDISEIGKYTDRCQENAVVEFFCNDKGYVTVEVHMCGSEGSYICEDGACIEKD